jgi:hypothetical protein
MRLGKLLSVGEVVEVVEHTPVEEPAASAQPEPLETVTDQERDQILVARPNR